MLKLFFTLVVVGCCSNFMAAQLPSNFPLYHEVVDYIIKHAECHVTLDQSNKLNVLKSPQGFFLTVESYQEDNTWEQKIKQLIWSPKEGFTKKILLEGDQSKQSIELYNFRKQPLPRTARLVDEYNVNRYFGNDNWTDQTIDYYHKYPPKDHEDYYSLGRAHSYKSAQYILTYGKHHLVQQEPTLLEELIKNAEKAIASFKKAHELAPDYNTIVGSIYTKYCNEILTFNMRLALLGLKEKALATVVGKELYKEETLAFAKNSLMSCPQNAILFTYGDNDTYPLLYLQQAKNIRPDVLIANESLLNADYYIDHLRDQAYYPQSYLQVDLKSILYQNTNNEYVLLERDVEKDIWSVKDLLQLLEADGEVIKRASTYGFVLGEYDKKLPTLICKNRYIIRSAILLLAIAEENYQKRPLLFTASYGHSPNNFAGAIGMTKYLHLQGSNYQFQYKEVDNNTLTKKQALKNHQLYTKVLEWPVFEKIAEEEFPVFHSSLVDYSKLVNALVEHKELKKAKEVQNIWYASFSKTLSEFGTIGQMRIIEQFSTLKQQEKVNSLLKNYLQHLLEEDFNGPTTQRIQDSILDKIADLITTNKATSLTPQFEQVKARFDQ